MINLLVYYLSSHICYSSVKFLVHDVGNIDYCKKKKKKKNVI